MTLVRQGEEYRVRTLRFFLGLGRGKHYSRPVLQTARKRRVATSLLSLRSHPALSYLEA